MKSPLEKKYEMQGAFFLIRYLLFLLYANSEFKIFFQRTFQITREKNMNMKL